MNKKVMNIVNFVRGIEPREDVDLYTPIKNEIDFDKKYNIPHTFLLQYDAMARKDIVDLFIQEQDENMEIGVWIELCREVVEKAGETWRGRENYDWEWFANVGHLEGYDLPIRERLIDLIFEKFKETFGYYPQVVGTWIFDSFSMNYIQNKYSVKAFCICREQFACDANTLWGGYYNGGFYPSKNNMICPAQTLDGQINVPTFRMLGPDPIYCYDDGKYGPKDTGKHDCFTMEPTWGSGQNSEIMDWYFDTYYRNPCVAFAHATTGQENSFGWQNFGKGYCMQIEKLAKLREEGILVIEKLGDTGTRFKRCFSQTPASALCALDDWSDNGCKSIWYNSRFYRANLFFNNGRLFFRDINKFDERYPARYLKEKLTTWDSRYDNLPIIDGYLWSRLGKECALEFCGTVLDLKAEENGDSSLKVTVCFLDGSEADIFFNERNIEFIGFEKSIYNLGTPGEEATVERRGNSFVYHHNNFTYKVNVVANIMSSDNDYVFMPIDNKIIIQLDNMEV